MKKLLLSLLVAVCAIANAQQVEFLVTASPGGPNDTVTRKLVEKLEKDTSINYTVINKPGAAHTIGYTYLHTSQKPTLILSTPEITSHEVFSSLEEVYTLGYFYNNLFVSEKSGVKSFSQLINLSKTRTINFGHGGIGTFSHAAMESLCSTQLSCLAVPYKSGANGMLALMSGEIDAYALVSYGSQQFLSNDKVVSIYSIKSTKEQSWFKLFAKNMSKKDITAIQKVLKEQDVKFYSEMGFDRR